MRATDLLFVAALTLAAGALAQTPDSSQLCPYGGATTQPAGGANGLAVCPASHTGGAATQPAAPNSNAAVCPVAASGAKAQATATINVRVVQGTPGGPAIGSDTVTVALYASGQVIDEVKVKLAPDGTLQVKGLPVSAAVQPLVSIEHAGATFTAVGEALDAQHASQQVQLTVYETTETPPPWKVRMRHIITQPGPAGVEVTDMIAIQNPALHAWIGKADATGRKQTVSLPLPPGATNVRVGGDLAEAGASFAGGRLLVSQPLLPGDSRYEIQYTIPAVNGAAQLLVTAPTDMQQILVFVPKNVAEPATTGLQALDAAALGTMAQKTRAFMATSLTAGQTICIKFTDLRSQASAAPDEGSEEAQEATPSGPPAAKGVALGAKVVAVGGAVAILACGGAVLLFKSPKPTDRA